MHCRGMIERLAFRIAVISATAWLAGCANLQHNDVLIFATQTKVALDVSTSPTSGGTPSFTLGYKREEGVWMPLVVNGKSSILLSGQRSCAVDGKSCWDVPPVALTAFQQCASKLPPDQCLSALMGEVKYVGAGEGRADTYSVFASFGGDFGALGGGKAALAQFFATGIAAQKLAANPHAPQALKVEDTNAQVVAAEQAARKATEQALQAAGSQAVDPAAKEAKKLADGTVECWNANRTGYRAAAAAKIDADSELMRIINADDETTFRGAVALSVADHDQIKAINAVACP